MIYGMKKKPTFKMIHPISYSNKLELKMVTKKVKIRGEEREFDISYLDANSGILLAVIVALAALNNPDVNRILGEFNVNVKDIKGNPIDFRDASQKREE